MKSKMLTIVLVIVNYLSNAQSVFPTNGDNVGVGTIYPSSYFHGGNNKVVEIFNPNTAINSQSHLILSTGSTIDRASAGTLTWVSKNSSSFQGMAYIGCSLQGDGAINAASRLTFATSNGGSIYPRMFLDKDGDLGIGTSDTKGYMLAVNGNVVSNSITVKMYPWADYVFNKSYHLLTLSEVKTYIDQNHHLPEVPSEKEVADKGLNLGEMNKLLMKKVEELTLYLIEKDKEIKTLEARLDKIEKN